MKSKLLRVRSLLMRRVLGRPGDLDSVCDRSWTIAPAEQSFERPAIFLDGELERVRALQGETTTELELRRIDGGRFTHEATRAYELSDVTLLAGRLFKGALNLRLSALSDEVQPFEHHLLAGISSTLAGSIYFGHWLHDDITLNLAVNDLAPAVEVARQVYRHEAGYRQLLSVDAEGTASARFDKLIMLDDRGQNAYKRERFEELRRRVRAKLRGQGNSLVYLKRGASRGNSGRDLVNAPDLESHLIERGFAVVDPDTMSSGEIAQAILGARCVIGIEGSHLAHALYPMAVDGTLVAIQPPRRFNNVFKDLADAMSLRYAFLVGEATAEGFSVSLERIDRLLDKLQAV